MDAREYYFNALQNKQIRDTQNPILDAAAAGWAGGIAKGIKNQEDDETLTKKSALLFGLDRQKQKQEMAKSILEKHDILVNGQVDNSPKTYASVFDDMLNGVDTPGVMLKPKTEKTTQTEEDKLKALFRYGSTPAQLEEMRQKGKNSKDETMSNLDKIAKNWTDQKNSILKDKDSKGNIDEIALNLVNQQLDAVNNKRAALMGLPVVKEETVSQPIEPGILDSVQNAVSAGTRGLIPPAKQQTQEVKRRYLDTGLKPVVIPVQPAAVVQPPAPVQPAPVAQPPVFEPVAPTHYTPAIEQSILDNMQHYGKSREEIINAMRIKGLLK